MVRLLTSAATVLLFTCLHLVFLAPAQAEVTPLAKLAPAEQQARLAGDLKAVQIYRDGLRSVMTSVASAPELFPPAKLRAALREAAEVVWKTGRGKGQLLTAKNAFDIVLKMGGTAWRPIQADVSERMGDTKVLRRNRSLISPRLARFPKRRFVLVGDSGEKDPEIYDELARKHPEQIVRTLIRDVTGEAADTPAIARLSRNCRT